MRSAIKALCLLFALLLTVTSLACASAPVAQTPSEVQTPSPTQAPTSAPVETPSPTEAPTPTPVPPEAIALPDGFTARRDGLTLTVSALAYAPNHTLELTVRAENDTRLDVAFALTSLTVNGWSMDGRITGDGLAVAAGESGETVFSLADMDTELFAAMMIGKLTSLKCGFTLLGPAGREETARLSCEATIPGGEDAVDAFQPGETVLLDNRNIKATLHSCDDTMEHVTLLLEKKTAAAWATCCVAPICNGYTDYLNPFVTMDKGSRLLLELDNSAIFERQGIRSLGQMDVYLTLQTPVKVDNSLLLTLVNPKGGETDADATEDPSPVVFSDQYAVLRYHGVVDDLMPAGPVILIDLENITQTYIKTMEIVSYPAHATIKLDGVSYDVATKCTYSYPRTHGYLMIWPVGAPEGALKAANTAEVKLKLSRFRSGHLDPVTDTGWFQIPLQ